MARAAISEDGGNYKLDAVVEGEMDDSFVHRDENVNRAPSKAARVANGGGSGRGADKKKKKRRSSSDMPKKKPKAKGK